MFARLCALHFTADAGCTYINMRAAQKALLGLGGITLVTLIPFLMRKKSRALKRKKATNEILSTFNKARPKLRARITENGDLVIEDNPAVLYVGPPEAVKVGL